MSSKTWPRPVAALDPASSQSRILLDGRLGLHQIDWRVSILEQLRYYSTEAYGRRSIAEEEVGGVLFGHRSADSLHVLAWRPLLRSGSSPSLSSPALSQPPSLMTGKDESLLGRLIQSSRSDPALRGMEAVGWFRSCTRGGAQMSDDDRELHRRMFAKEWQFCLVVRPSHQRPTQAAVYMRDEAGQLSTAGSIQLRPGPVDVEIKPVSYLPLPEFTVDKGLDAIEDLPVETAPTLSSRRLIQLALLGLAIFTAILAVTMFGLNWYSHYQLDQLRATGLKATLQLRVQPEPGAIVVRWDPDSAALKGANQLNLDIDGTVTALTRQQLQSGFTRIPLAGGAPQDLPVRLFGTSERGVVVEEFTRLIDPSR